MKKVIKLLNILFQLLILLIIIDQTMPQCGIRWRGTCNTYRRSQNTNQKMLKEIATT